MHRFERTEQLLGAQGMERLAWARVAVFGVGGAGGHAAEAIARCGVGAIDIIDKDIVDETNINRQTIASEMTLGAKKTDAMRAKILSVNPRCIVTTKHCFFLPENAGEFDFTQYDYVVDAVDTVTAKLQIICQAKAAGVPVISCMGTGNKLDPTAFMVADISKTSVCPLAKVVRKELRKRGVKHVKVVYSKELPIVAEPDEEGERRSPSPGSVSFVPPVAGLIMASEVVKDIAFARC